MTVLPELERMLVLGAGGLSGAAPAPAARSSAPAPARRRRRLRRRWGAVAFAVAVLAGTAVAERAPWMPWVGSERGGYPTLSLKPPDAPTLDLLSVLRRAQTATDRDSETQAMLRLLGSRLQGVRAAYVRNLAPDVAWGAVTLVSVERYGGRGPAASKGAGGEALCVLYPVAGPARSQGATMSCWNAGQIAAGEAFSPKPSIPRLFGLVPDGVASVDIQLAGGRRLSAPVHENFFDVAEPTKTPTAARAITWRDATGRAAGPPLPGGPPRSAAGGTR